MLQRCNAATLHRCIAAMLRWGGATITPCSTTCNWQPATMSIDSRRGGSYELGIDCKFAPEPFHRTRLVFICPRFVIANEASFPLHYMQARATRRRCSAGSCKEACWWVEVGLGRESSSRRSSPRGDALSASPSSPPPTRPAPSPDVPGGHGALVRKDRLTASGGHVPLAVEPVQAASAGPSRAEWRQLPLV